MSGTGIPAALPEKSGAARKLEPVISPRNRAESPAEGKVPPKADGQHTVPNPRAELPQAGNVPARELVKQMAAGLALPKDALSAALIAVTRFLSLPLKPETLAALRREILDNGKASSPATAREEAALEAETLALVSAGDKGVALRPETLERYARFFLPPDFDGESGGGENAGSDTGGGHGTGAESDAGGSPREGEDRGRNAGDNPRGGKAPEREEVPAPEELAAIAGAQSGREGFLDLLNSIPGKNGQYWMVFPFKINVKGTELQVFLRILKREVFSPGEEEQLIADITGPAAKWRCVVKRRDKNFRADIQVYPERGPAALNFLRKEAERFLGAGGRLFGNMEHFGEIIVRNGDEAPSWVDDFSAACLLSVNKDI